MGALVNRRHFMIGAVGAAASLWWMRPSEQGEAGHNDYFSGLSATLRQHGLLRPTMVLDLDRLDANIDTTVRAIAPRDFRVVAKSLPCSPLLDYVMKRAETKRLMVFHQPFLNAIADSHPKADLLLGKPMPVAAANRFFEHLGGGGLDPTRQIQWLIDRPERLRQYRELAHARDLSLTLNIEIDVGLHRGGMKSPRELSQMLEIVRGDARLRFGGLMGYDAHAALPEALGFRRREFNRVEAKYRAFLDVLAAEEPHSDPARPETPSPWLLNAAGSPTYRLWDEVEGVANELSVGSGLVKPLDFDVDTLAEHVPALFIATPILKVQDGLEIPAIDLGPLHSLWNPNRRRSFFLYGGFWKARPVSPIGLETHPIYGRSTNQELWTGSRRIELGIDDLVFFRPTQSEFVMLQFGRIAVVRGGEVVDSWEPLSQPA